MWFTLIGAGGGGNSSTFGGTSGAVTNFMCPAFLIPDVLQVSVGRGGGISVDGTASTIAYQQKATTGYTLLTASGGLQGGSGALGGAAMTPNYFTPIGFFQSVAGQGVVSGTASTTTFLSAGYSGSPPGTVTANYGYSVPPNSNGFFQMQPIIVGAGGSTGAGGVGGVGCGGGPLNRGGDGLVVIITW